MPEILPSPRLPWELLDAFVDELGLAIADPSSLDALRNCALTCHHLHFRADGYIFSDITITPSFKPQPDPHVRIAKRLEDLHHILTKNDSIASRVRSFTIDTALGSVAPAETRQMILENEDLPEILGKLTKLHHFGWINHGATFSWSSLSEDIRSGLDSLFVLPSLRSLTLECIKDLPPVSIARCDQLEHLHLFHVYVPFAPAARRPSENVQAPSSEARMKLKSVANYNSFDMFGALFPTEEIAAASFRGLRDLHTWIHNETQASFAWCMMQAASKTLELLDIPDLSHFRYPTLIPGPINIGVLHRLHTIKMGCRLTTLDGVIFPQGIVGLLSAPAEPTLIETVQIKLDWIDCRVGSEARRFVHEPHWGALDGVLADAFVYPALRRVEMTLRMGYGWAEREDKKPPRGVFEIKNRVERMAGGLLPRVSGSGRAKVSIDLQLYNSPYASKLSYVEHE